MSCEVGPFPDTHKAIHGNHMHSKARNTSNVNKLAVDLSNVAS